MYVYCWSVLDELCHLTEQLICIQLKLLWLQNHCCMYVPMQVMIFNGWRYVGSPAIGFLEKAIPSSKSYGLRSTLLLKVHYYTYVLYMQ